MLRAAPPSPLKGPATWMEEEEEEMEEDGGGSGEGGGFLSSHMGAFTSHVRSIRLPLRMRISSSAPKEECPN